MAELARIGIAIDEDLLAKFDQLIERRGYVNRSEAVRDLVRNELIQESWQNSKKEMFGTVTLVYDHHVRLLTGKLTEIQHRNHTCIIASMHAHLDHDNCLEVILLRGKAATIQKLADALIATKGVRHGRFTATTPHH